MQGHVSTSVGAKFKSLSSRALDIWWEDGRSGVAQGTLRPGRETTTNTYEGHVFYFTESGNKANEIARVYISSNQVYNHIFQLCILFVIISILVHVRDSRFSNLHNKGGYCETRSGRRSLSEAILE